MSFSSPNHSKINGLYQAFYLKDQWMITPEVRVEAGFRYDPFRIWGAFPPFDGQQFVNYSNLSRQLQPRLGLTWDVAKDGKTKVYAAWGRFFQVQGLGSVGWAQTQSSTYSSWLSGFTYNPDYSGTTPPITIQAPPTTTQTYGTVGTPTPQATNLRLPHKDRMSLGIDKALPGGWKVGAEWSYWTLENVQATSYFTNADGSAATMTDAATGASVGGPSVPVIWNPDSGSVSINMATDKS